MNRGLILVLLATVASAFGGDQSPKEKLDALKSKSDVAAAAWAQEPTTFLGIKLGEPIESSVSECPYQYIGNYKSYVPSRTREACYRPMGEFFRVENIANFFDVFIDQVDGKVAQVSAHFAETKGATVELALVEKFGKPHKTEHEQVHTRMNVEYSKTTETWSGPNVVIEYESIGSKIDEGRLTASTASYHRFLLEKAMKDVSDVKNSF